MYHKYCARLIYAWGGTLGMGLQATVRGRAFMEEIEKISMEDVRRLIRRLIVAGYDRRVPNSQSDQQIHTMYETTVKNVGLARDLKSELCTGAEFLKGEASCIRKLFQEIHGNLMPICKSIDAHPVNQARHSVSDIHEEPQRVGWTAKGQLEHELRDLALRGLRTEAELLEGHNEDEPQPLDSDEEAQLHAELDTLVEMQERVEAMGGNQNKYMASVFQRACLQITEIEGMYLELTNIFHRAAASTDTNTIPAVTLNEFSAVLDTLNLSNISQSDLEEMFEQGMRHVSFRKSSKTSEPVASDNTESSRVSEVNDLDLQDPPDEDARVAMTSLMVGSEMFREKLMSIVTDLSYCHMAEAASLKHLDDQQIKALSFGGRVRTVAKNEVFLNELQLHAKHKSNHQSSASKDYMHQASTLDDTSDAVHAAQESPPRPESPVARSNRHQMKTSETWFLVISGNLMVEEDPLRLEQKLYSELGPGDIFGGYKTLAESRTPFHVKAIKGCQLLELPRFSLLEFRARESEEAVRLLSSKMGEAPLSAARAALGSTIQMFPERAGNGNNDSNNGSLSEIQLQSLKLALSKIDQVWQEICLGEEVVPLSQFTAFQPYLGEVGSELFKKLFAGKGVPEHISKAVYWEIWISFLTFEAYGKRISENAEIDDEKPRDELESFVIDSEVPEEYPDNCFELLHTRFSKARRMGHRFFDSQVVERYEQSFVAVTGDLGEPLTASKINLFLERLFPDFSYHVSVYNCREFLQTFGREGVKSKQITFADIRKVLIECSKETHHDGLFINGALNRNSEIYAYWLNVVSVVACLEFILVPVRLCFVPWTSMLDIRALALDVTLDFLVLIHVVVLANTAYRNTRGQWATTRLKMLRRINIFYLVAAIPSDWFAYIFGASYEMCNWLRVPKLVLAFEMFVRGNGQSAPKSTRRRILELSMVLMALLHIAACAWFYIGTRYKEWHPGSAVSWCEIDPSLASLARISYEDRFGLRPQSSVWDQYLISLYWVTATLTSYGIVGDILPQNNTEIVYTMVLMVMNITVFGYIIGEVSSVFMIQDEEVTKARTQLGAVESFIRGSKLEDDLRDEIKLHFRATRMHSSSDQAAIFRRMSRSLQVEVSSYTTRGYLDGVPLFQGCSPQLIDAVSVLLSEVTFAPEDYLYRVSEIAREMFFVIDGSVDEITENDKGEKVEAVIKAGGTIGVLSFFFGMRHLASARAGKLAGAVCLRLSREEFMDMLKLYPEEEGRIAQSALKSFEGARSQYGSRHASSLAPSTRTGESKAVSSAFASSSDGRKATSEGDDVDSSEAFTQALGGSGIRQRMAVLKRRRENKRIYGILTAASKGDLHRLKASLQIDGDCNTFDHFRRTPLHVAASQGQLEAVRVLLAARADLDARDRFENTPLNDAVRHRNDAVALLLRERSPDLSISLKGHEIGGLMCQSAYVGDLEHVRRLILNRASPSACDYDRRSALHLASCQGHIKIVQHLLDAQADPHARDRFGGAPLDDAVRHGHTLLQKLLCGHGARLTGEKYAFKICEAAATGDLETIQTLVENGINTAAGDYDGRTALHLAASEGQISVLHYLLGQDPPLDINCVDRVGGTPLEDAVRHKHRVAEMMIEEAGGMRRHERRLSELVGNYQAHLEPNRIDVLLRVRRNGAFLRLKNLRADGVQAATEACIEAKAVEAVRNVLLPALRTRLETLDSLFGRLAEEIRIATPILLSALQMDSTGTRMGSGKFLLSLKGGKAANDLEPTNPIETTVHLLALLPELAASIATAREAMDAPLPRCRLVQMYAKAFRREATALRAEVRRLSDATRLLRRILRGAQTVFRTRTFRNILRRAISFSSICTSLTSTRSAGKTSKVSSVDATPEQLVGSEQNTQSADTDDAPFSEGSRKQFENSKRQVNSTKGRVTSSVDSSIRRRVSIEADQRKLSKQAESMEESFKSESSGSTAPPLTERSDAVPQKRAQRTAFTSGAKKLSSQILESAEQSQPDQAGAKEADAESISKENVQRRAPLPARRGGRMIGRGGSRAVSSAIP